jgi:hypothetical protein
VARKLRNSHRKQMKNNSVRSFDCTVAPPSYPSLSFLTAPAAPVLPVLYSLPCYTPFFTATIMGRFETRGNYNLAAFGPRSVLKEYLHSLTHTANEFLLDCSVQQLLASDGLAGKDFRFLMDFKARQDAFMLSPERYSVFSSFLFICRKAQYLAD